jgi:eukaryotic-like serine/threonine-protein kinase
MKCLNCGHENREGAKFCVACAQSLVTGILCQKCNHINPHGAKFCEQCAGSLVEKEPTTTKTTTPQPASQPTSFANGRYQVKKFLGEGGKKKVYLAHDTVLDRDVAFALIKTEKLDETGRTRIKREVQAMGKLGDNPNIVTVYDFGDHEGQPFIVLPLLSGGDVEGLIKKATDHKLSIEKSVEISIAVCKGLEFAHAKGIIHRDIKPGNVWLSSDGTAKVGDFGLAVAVEKSRLTMSGMMVGTVAYMPPEQAMGGKVTAKADLYSLGAMLYEMVTGRPPFIGDDSVSIIGQHINTPPVSPAWHRADLPPSLDTLIMQLLEKDPEKRPDSAAVVLKALETIVTAKIQKETAKETQSKENPIYRRVFVGREPELKQLQNAFDSAMSGQGALMMVMGEPGIGKTALCEQLATYVTLRGGKTLVGHCYEEGSLSLPYLAFVEAMRSYVLNRELKDLREELGTGATDVARIVSEIGEKLKVKPRPPKDPEEERYRLMQAVTSFLTNTSVVQPLLIVLEDLHDADKGTLDMLTYVARHFIGTRILIVGTYRDVEVDRNHPLSASLADLRRIANYGRVALRGLNADEVRRMMETITRESIPWSLAEVVHRQTEGNPLFVQEVIRFLVEEGLITQKNGRLRPAKDTPVEMNIPEGLRDVIGKRLSLISKPCNQVLSTASVIGREFGLEVLKKVSGLSEESLFNALEEAKKAAVVEEHTGMGVAVSYRFAHAFFRQTLYEELIAPRRIRLHQQVARALEEVYSRKLEEHAAELAEHFSYSSDTADLKKAVSYGEMAAMRANGVYAFGETVRLLEQVLKVQEILDPADKVKHCDLLLDLCDTLLNVPDIKRIFESEAQTAFSLAVSLNDNKRIIRACRYVLSAMGIDRFGLYPEHWLEWIRRADQYAQPGTVERVYADGFLGMIKCASGDMKSGQQLLSKAIDLAHQLGDRECLWSTAVWIFNYFNAHQHIGQVLNLAQELLADQSGIPLGLYAGLNWVGGIFMRMGQRRQAEEAWDKIRTKAQQTGAKVLTFTSQAMDIVLATMDGKLEKALEMAENLRIFGEENGIQRATWMYYDFTSFRAHLYLGKSLEMFEQQIQKNQGQKLIDPNLCLVQAYLSKNQPALESLGKYINSCAANGKVEDDERFWYAPISLEAAIILKDKRAAELLLNFFSGTSFCTTDWAFSTCIPRHLGAAAVLLEKYEEARKHYAEAVRICNDMKFRPELALSKLQLAELLLEHYPAEKKDALEHLDFAIKEFREMKMQPSLERALRHKDILKA